ncbi:MAG: hypothetical protein LBQ31_03730 [Bacteroidales bacterium]|nr:hypothetical protein [Bacteroidales bacterium]
MSKVLFLDIDRVLQPESSQERFKHIDDIDSLYKKLFDTYGIDYSVYFRYDVAAVYYDWNKQSVAELKRILETTGAKIVVSSDWRLDPAPNMLLDFFKIHGLDKYFAGSTPKSISDYKKSIYKDQHIYDSRSMAILEYLEEHPEIEKWISVGDLPLYHNYNNRFKDTGVVTYVTGLERNVASKCIEILNS